MVGQHTGIGHESQTLNNLFLAGIEVVLAHDHSSSTATSDDGSRCVGCEYGLPAGAIRERLAEVTRKATEHIDQAGLVDLCHDLWIVGRGVVDEWKHFDSPGTKVAKPVLAIATCTLRVVVGSGCRGNDADGSIGTAC